MKQQLVLRHISSIYLDKIKTLKTSEREETEDSYYLLGGGGVGAVSGRTLNVVTYDYFLN